VLAAIQKAQIERDRMRLDSKKLTVREKNRIRAGWAEAAPDMALSRTVAKWTSLLCGRTFLLCLDIGDERHGERLACSSSYYQRESV
jgi:hypothetical protein